MMRPHKKGMPDVWPAVALLAGMAAVPATIAPAEAAEVRITPRLEVRETYTDNVNLTPTDSLVPGEFRRDDFVTTLSPGISASIQGTRVQLLTSYTANYLIFADLGTDDLRHNLTSSATVEAVENFFFIETQASINQQFLDRERGFSGSEANITDNRGTTRTVSASPFATTRFGQIAQATARYQFSYVSTDEERMLEGLANVLTDSQTHLVTVDVVSGPAFGRLQWTLNGRIQRESRQDAANLTIPDFDQERFGLDVRYALNRTFSLEGSVGFGDTSDLTLTEPGNNLFWDVGVGVNPNRRLSANLRYGRTQGNRTFSGSLSYKWTERTLVAVSYSDSIRTSQGTLADNLNQIDIGDGGFVDDGGFPFDPTPPNLGFDSRISRDKNLRGDVQYSSGRNTFAGGWFVLRREFDQFGGEALTFGGNARISRNLSPRTSASLDFDIRRDEFEQSDRTDWATVGQAIIRHSLSQMLAGRLTFVRSDRNSNEPGSDIKEIAVTLALEASF